MMSVSVIILTRNEELHLARAIASIKMFATEIFVIDSFSTDETVAIAQRNGAIVTQRAFINHSDQFQWGLDNLPITSQWTMRLDADEVIDPDLAQEIVEKLPALTLRRDVVAVDLKRRHVFMGRWVRHGGRYPLILTRLWRTGAARIEDRWMDEHIVVDRGRRVLLDNYFSDINLNDLTHFINKHNKYASCEAIDILSKKYSLLDSSEFVENYSLSKQANIKRWIKDRIYNKLPFGLAPFLYFFYRYVFQQGFRDGKEGAIYHVLQGFWYRFLVQSKVLEFDRVIGSLHRRDERINALAALTGMKLRA